MPWQPQPRTANRLAVTTKPPCLLALPQQGAVPAQSFRAEISELSSFLANSLHFPWLALHFCVCSPAFQAGGKRVEPVSVDRMPRVGSGAGRALDVAAQQMVIPFAIRATTRSPAPEPTRRADRSRARCRVVGRLHGITMQRPLRLAPYPETCRRGAFGLPK